MYIDHHTFVTPSFLSLDAAEDSRAMTLTRIGHAPGSANETAWHNALSNAFAAVSGRVCSVCGLDGVGHAPATAWLGYD